jgi:hypothetical protein
VKIGVSATGEGIDPQTRAYAEYRLFSRLAPSEERVTGAAIALIGTNGRPRMAVCSISLDLHHGGRLRVSARAPHIYDAIDQAVEGAAKGVHAHDARCDA